MEDKTTLAKYLAAGVVIGIGLGLALDNFSVGIGLGVAIDYLEKLDLAGAFAHEHELMRYTTEQLATIPGLRIIGTAEEKAGVISFHMDDVHPHDIGTILDQDEIAIRTGHHCTQPIMEFYDIPATARVSFAFYNTKDDVDRLITGLHKVVDLFT